MDVHTITNSFAQISIQWVVIAALFAIVSFDAVRSGTTKAIALSLALPITAYLFTFVPKTVLIGGVLNAPTPIVQAVILALILAGLFVLIHRMISAWSDSSVPILWALLVGFATTAVMLATALSVPALTGVWHPGEPLMTLFGASYRLLWILGAYLALAFIRS